MKKAMNCIIFTSIFKTLSIKELKILLNLSIKRKQERLTTPYIGNGGQSEAPITALHKHLNVPGEVFALKSATGHMRNRCVKF